jgi:hypothetical protein
VVLRGNRATFLIGELDGRPSERVAALTADIAGARATTGILGYLWAKVSYGAMLFATAVSDLPIHAVLADPAYRPLLVAVAAEVLAQAPVPVPPLDGFDPADLPGSLERLAEFNRGSAKTHSGIYRDLAVRHRQTEAAAILGPLRGALLRRITELIAAIERGERRCARENLDLLAAHERLARRAGRRAGRWPDSRWRSRTSSRCKACRPAAAAPPPPASPPPRTRRWCAGCARRARRCSPPRSAWSSRPGSPTR